MHVVHQCKGWQFFLLNDDLYREQTHTEAKVLLNILLNSLSCTGRRSSSLESIKDPPLL